jgi:hypothetical protein
MSDALTLDAPTRTQDGYLAVRAKAARVGHYVYQGRDVDPDNKHGLRDAETVNVARDAATVFDKKAVHSFIGKPITNDHPHESVTAANWKDHARGTIMGAKWEEGGYLAFDLLLTDASAIAAVDSGKRELSNGYSAELEFGDFTAPDGVKCQARQTSISGNHVALVDRGRAGPDCRIVDAAICDAAPQSFLDSFNKEKPVVTMLIDGLTVDVSNADTAKATIATILAARDEARSKVAGLETNVATLTTDKATLEQKLKDSTPSAQQLRDAARAYGVTLAKAKALGVSINDTMDAAAIMKATVSAKLGDTAKDWNDVQVAASFAALTIDTKVDDAADPLRDAIRDQPLVIADASAVRNLARSMQY